MSNLDREAVPALCGGRGFVVAEPVRELLSPRRVQLGESTEVRRLLPNLGRRMVGAWCFVDHYGPDDIADEPGMQVPPHPHMGLQTVSWLHEGEVLHRDSTGSVATIRPRELGLMTSGRAISHAEQSPKTHARFLHGAQLWVALPDSDRHVDPHFEHHAELPVVTAPGLRASWAARAGRPCATPSHLLGQRAGDVLQAVLLEQRAAPSPRSRRTGCSAGPGTGGARSGATGCRS
jgi:redox-sensitive bicupin YhaK (pirin superfamily)